MQGLVHAIMERWLWPCRELRWQVGLHWAHPLRAGIKLNFTATPISSFQDQFLLLLNPDFYWHLDLSKMLIHIQGIEWDMKVTNKNTKKKRPNHIFISSLLKWFSMCALVWWRSEYLWTAKCMCSYLTSKSYGINRWLVSINLWEHKGGLSQPILSLNSDSSGRSQLWIWKQLFPRHQIYWHLNLAIFSFKVDRNEFMPVRCW